MKDFEVDENGMTVTGLNKLSSKSMKSMYTWNMIRLALDVLAGFCAVYFLVTMMHYDKLYIPVAVYGLVAIVAVYLVLSPPVFYARYRYKVSEDRIDILRGVITIRHTVVPIERVHQVEVTRGPVNNMYGLADVTITTAGGIAVIQYLELDEAEKIADHLNTVVNRVVGERCHDV
jgi:uncharacterized protein